MTYSSGNVIVANDYMNFRGSIAPSSAYASDATAQGKVAALIGVGYGTRGYGLTTTNLVAVSSNVSVVGASQWNSLRSAIEIINIHTGSNVALPPPISQGSLIYAEDAQSGRSNLVATINTIDANRLSVVTSQVTSNVVTSSTKTVAWTNSIYHEFTATFGSEDMARYFFNSGSSIRLYASRTGGSNTAINTAMTAMFTAMGNIRIQASSTIYTGTGGTGSSIGYYGLTSSYQQLFKEQAGGSYPNAYYQIEARRENYTGNNGANGTTIRVRANINLGGYPVTVDGTLVNTVASERSSGVVTVTNPTYATTFNL